MSSTESVGAAFVCAPALTEWGLLVSQVQSDSETGMAELYRRFQKGVRYLLARQLRCPTDVDDGVHDIFCIVVKAIARGDIRNPDCLPGFVRTVTKRQIAQRINDLVKERNTHADLDDTARLLADRQPDPEREMQISERTNQVRKALARLSRLDRELLTRFYLDEQSAADICRELKLTSDQFRNLKSRAKKKVVAAFAKHAKALWITGAKRIVLTTC